MNHFSRQKNKKNKFLKKRAHQHFIGTPKYTSHRRQGVKLTVITFLLMSTALSIKLFNLIKVNNTVTIQDGFTLIDHIPSYDGNSGPAFIAVKKNNTNEYRFIRGGCNFENFNETIYQTVEN